MKKAGNLIRIVLLFLCAAVFLVCSVMLVRILIGYRQADDVYESINQGFEQLPNTEGEKEFDTASESELDNGEVLFHDTIPESVSGKYAYLMELQETYPDVVGYISVPSLSIRYPVVQTDNNDYYLDHLITGEKNVSGAIFLDSRCDADVLRGKNTVIYGHNMNDGSMFHNLEKLFDKDVFLNAKVEYITEWGVFLFKPLSIYRADATYPFSKYKFLSDEEYLKFCQTAVEKSRFTESESVRYDAKSSVITLVTCTNAISSTTGRYVFQAILDEVYPM